MPLKDNGPAPVPGHAAHQIDPLATITGLASAAPIGLIPNEFGTPNPNFAGMGNAGNPPDTNGAVGPNHYIQTVNSGRAYAIWDKQGTLLVGPRSMQQIWIDGGAPTTDDCRVRMRGDPYVVYDHMADRWVLTQFANKGTNSGDPLQIQCIAVSQGPDPVNDGWFAYTFDLGFSNDYPKLAVWPDGYYLVSQRGYLGNQIDVTVFDRVTMLNGGAATFQSRAGDPNLTIIMLPSELEGPQPPAGTPAFYVRPIDGALFGGNDRIEVYEFDTDWGVPVNTSFTLVATLTPSAFSSDICAGASLNNYCIPQPGVPDLLETLSVWPMVTANFRDFGTHQSLVFNHSVDVDGAGLVGVRWYELRRDPGSGAWSLYQEGTYSPPDGQNVNRWMGSIAMDSAGNMALGYSVSNNGTNGNVFPGIRYTGRLATDPLGTMPYGENILANGTSAATSASNQVRWGDYSTMRVDPVDGCTFWYTTHFRNGNAGNSTRIGAFRFPSCNPADLSISKSDSPDPVLAGNQLNYTLTVRNHGPSTATEVVVTDVLPSGVEFLDSSIPCTNSSGTLTCDLDDMKDGDTQSFTVQVKVGADYLSSRGVSTDNLSNEASVAAHELDPDTSNNSVIETTNVIESADVRITKVCKPDGPAQSGATGFCDLLVTNLGVSDAQGVVVTDTLTSDSAFTVTSYSTTAPVSCAPATPSGPVTEIVVTCNVGILEANASTTIRVNVTASEGADINDVADVASTTTDSDLSNNEALGAVIFTSSANLSITKSSLPQPVVAGTNLTYTITAANAGPSPAENVIVTDTLPAGVSLVSTTPDVGSCSGGIPGDPTQPLTCALGTLNAGASTNIVVVVLVSASVPDGTILINNGSIGSDTTDSDNSDNVVTATSPVITESDLAITKVVDDPTYKSGRLVTFTIDVTNNGPSDALAVVVTDTLPNIPQLIYQGDTGGCTIIGNILTCQLGNMPTGTNKSFDVQITVRGNRGTLTNTAAVSSSTTDPTAANDSASVDIVF